MSRIRQPGLALAAVFACAMAAGAAEAAPRVLSLDQCADQYVMALAPREAIVGLSPRADDADSLLRARAKGLPLRRVGLEPALAAGPQVVVRFWGGDVRLLSALQARGIPVVTIDEAKDFNGVRANVRRVARAVGEPEAGEALIARMNAKLTLARGAWGGKRALYLTPGGATAGPGTFIDALMRAAGLTNATTTPGYRTVSLEQLVLNPPDAAVLGFFDTFQLAGDSWGPGSHRILHRIVSERAIASLPGSTLSCPTWAAADAAALLAGAARR